MSVDPTGPNEYSWRAATYDPRYLRLAEPPMLRHTMPVCDACDIPVEYATHGGWRCPSCGTTWGYEDEDDPAPGTLTDQASGPECPNKYAWEVANLRGEKRDARVEKIIAATKERS